MNFYLFIPMLTGCINGYNSSLVNGWNFHIRRMASDVSDVTPDRITDSPSMAAPISQSTWKDARYSLFIVRIEVKSLPVVLGMITSAQIIGSLLVRRNIGANPCPLTCLVLQGPPFGSLLFRLVRSTGDSGRGSYLYAWWCGITSVCINGRRIYCSATAW